MQNPRAIGHLRLPGPRRYESNRDPTFDQHGTTIGFLLDGIYTLGYTFACVYARSCFWIAHQGYGLVASGSVSLAEATGTFLFSAGGMKFRSVKSFGFDGPLVDGIRAFKLLDNGAYLLYLTSQGVCLFDTHRRDIVAKVEFKDFANQWSYFALSPKVKLLAIAGSARGNKDPLDGEYRYGNFVRIYNLETGVVAGEQALPGDRETRWTVDFSVDGRQVRAVSDSSTYVFELMVSR